MHWSIAGKALNEKAIFARLAALVHDGPTGIILIGADGALKSSVISKLWKNIPTAVPLHPYGGAQPDLARGKVVVDSPLGLDIVDHAKQQSSVTHFLSAGAKNVVAIWVRYPDESGWTTDTGRTIDRILCNNPPDQSIFTLLISVQN